MGAHSLPADILSMAAARATPAYHAVEEEEGPAAAAAAVPTWWASLLDVDDGPMLRKRELVMNICIVQVLLSFTLLTNWRRSPVLLVLQPFFISAGILGYIGAKQCKALFVAAHFCGSAGLALVFMFFILAETFLKHTQGQQTANADLFFIILNAPMDLFLLSTSGASVILYLSLSQLCAPHPPSPSRHAPPVQSRPNTPLATHSDASCVSRALSRSKKQLATRRAAIREQ